MNEKVKKFCYNCHSCKKPCGKEEVNPNLSKKREEDSDILIKGSYSRLTMTVELRSVELAYQSARYFENCSFEKFLEILNKKL